MPRAVVFDYGGVLMKTLSQEPRHAWDRRLGLSLGSVEGVVHGSAAWHQLLIGRITPEAYWQAVAAQLGLDAAAVARLAQDYYSADQLDQSLVQLIETLRAESTTVGLLSNAPVTLPDELAALSIAHLFQPLVVSSHIGVAKPDAGAYQALLMQLQRPAEDVIFIDDVAANIQAASALGIHGLLYTAGMDVMAALRPLLT